MHQVKLVEDSLLKFEEVWIALVDHTLLTFLKGCVPQVLLGPFLNTFTHLLHHAQFSLINFQFDILSQGFRQGKKQQNLRNEKYTCCTERG